MAKEAVLLSVFVTVIISEALLRVGVGERVVVGVPTEYVSVGDDDGVKENVVVKE